MTRAAASKIPALSVATSGPLPPALRARGRSGSIVKVEQVGPSSQEEVLDQSAYANVNAEWVNRKGAWLIHPVLIVAGKILIDTLPGMNQQVSWTLTNLLYIILSYFIFHWQTGIPFDNELHGGAYDDLTLWEQIDEGAQYTPAKKWLITVPIVLFLLSTHFTQYNPWVFAINLTALILGLVPKLPQAHRQRVRFMSDEASGVSTPVTPGFPSGSGTPTPNGTASSPPVPHLTDSYFQ
ncbi:Orm1 type endoplasmic reticulum protein [Gloeophyllum trabeum ATCC 11539]|uniref:Orm1 type endoplasmic reticulum protein n=1 Tax=Gloeophyllum trabeum (strain ATCC 11539 / FP-39264 / Madison 617) TaxID=670483 RepID=S7S0E8_GLOTA|nr:Orm1 type endoplasmic reticulum protein [Gloeophyllum trabeum ATCC 11539]EPQ59194.1 Orm1 type endoplasmic reticulum protein [Gloeophyllum trabeum ATCC 11539]